MASFEISRPWPARYSRRRYVPFLVFVSFTSVLSVFHFSTARMTDKVHARILKRAEPEQATMIPEHTETTALKIAPTTAIVDTTATSPNYEVKNGDMQTPFLEPIDTSNRIQTPNIRAFPAYEKYSALINKSSQLPDIVYIPFEDAVREDVLEGWEAEWLLNGTYDAKTFGMFKEPRIDFVYTCKLLLVV